MTNPWTLRLMYGVFLAVGLGLLLTRGESPTVQAKDAEAKMAMTEAIQSNIDYLKAKLAKDPERRAIPRIHGVAMILAQEAQMTGDVKLRDQAIKVAEAVDKKDFATAKTAADALAVGESSDSITPIDLSKTANIDLANIMSVFSLERVGGLEIEKNIRVYSKTPTDKKAIQAVAQNCVAIGEYTKHLPTTEVAGSADNKKAWDKLTADMIAISKEIGTEAAKGADASDEMLVKKFLDLDDTCYNCHEKFRD